MLLLLSPSKTLEERPSRTVGTPSQPVLIKQTGVLLPLLKKKSAKDLAKLMDISAKLAELNHARYQRMTLPLSAKNASQCLFMFKGDVYEGLDAASLTDKEARFANNHVRILSGLYGVLRPMDLMHPYRLEMGIRLKNPYVSGLYDFWGDAITAVLNTELAQHKSKLVLNLASEEYGKAVRPKKLEADWVSVVFKEKKGNQFKVIGIHAKRARGLMARFIVQQGIDNPKDVTAFDAEGYRFEKEMSGKNNLVFAR
jgi:cytoplasmic iron level regulating protein YaaA (DUF328/UPF0246 family)